MLSRGGASRQRDDGEFIDLDPARPAERVVEREHRRYEIDFALGAADADARKGDFRGALGWLEVVEELTMVFPPAYLARREEWRRALPGAKVA